MNRLRKVFEELYGKFGRKKTFFERQVENWKKRGKTTWYEKGKGLIDILENEGRELTEMFSSAAASVDTALAKSKVKLFKKTYKQLHEVTKPAWRQWIEALIIAVALRCYCEISFLGYIMCRPVRPNRPF